MGREKKEKKKKRKKREKRKKETVFLACLLLACSSPTFLFWEGPMWRLARPKEVIFALTHHFIVVVVTLLSLPAHEPSSHVEPRCCCWGHGVWPLRAEPWIDVWSGVV